MVTTGQLKKFLFWYFNRYDYMVLAYYKSAKRERVRKKWRKRFGFGMKEQIYHNNPFLALIPKDDLFPGSYIPLPLFYGES